MTKAPQYREAELTRSETRGWRQARIYGPFRGQYLLSVDGQGLAFTVHLGVADLAILRDLIDAATGDAEVKASETETAP